MPRHALHRFVDQARRDERGRADTRPVRAELGAILCRLLRTAVGAGGPESLWFRAVRTSVDAHGHRLEIYGSGGWGFESLRACDKSPGRWPCLRHSMNLGMDG